MQAGDLNDPAVASVLKDEIERKNKKVCASLRNMTCPCLLCVSRDHKGATKDE
jgi:hypothetical protein